MFSYGTNYLLSPDTTPIEYQCQSLSSVQLFVTPWTVARQASWSMDFSRQEYWRGVASSFSRGSSQPRSPALQADSLPSEPPGTH